MHSQFVAPVNANTSKENYSS